MAFRTTSSFGLMTSFETRCWLTLQPASMLAQKSERIVYSQKSTAEVFSANPSSGQLTSYQKAKPPSDCEKWLAGNYHTVNRIRAQEIIPKTRS